MKEREYQKTHSWINFELNLQKIDYKIWMALGEIQSKCVHIAGVPLKPSIAAELNRLYLAKGALATTAIEGNTLTEKEIVEQLKGQLRLPPSRAYLAQETENIINLFSEIDKAINENKDENLLKPKDIFLYNKKILYNIPLDEAVSPGAIRNYSTVVGNYRCPAYQDCDYLLNELCNWINTMFREEKGSNITFGLLKAIIAHLYFVWIHPFGDGNGRTARMIEFEILRRAGVPSPSAHLLSNHYNQTRNLYYLKLSEASKDKEFGVIKFIEYAINGFLDGLKEQIKLIRTFQWDISWTNYIYECFSDKNTKSDKRRLKLILAISEQNKLPIPLSELRHLTPELAESYATASQKQLYQDVDYLEKVNLLIRSSENKISYVRPTQEHILAFLPINIDDPLFDELL